jgi:hypothetical protein
MYRVQSKDFCIYLMHTEFLRMIAQISPHRSKTFNMPGRTGLFRQSEELHISRSHDHGHGREG